MGGIFAALIAIWQNIYFITVRDADVIVVVEKGKILERGTHRELLQIEDGIYRGLYKVQNDER